MSNLWAITFKDVDGGMDIITYHKDVCTQESAIEKFLTVAKGNRWTIVAVGEVYEEPLSRTEKMRLRNLICELDQVLSSEKLKQVLFDSGGLSYASELRNAMADVKDDYEL